MVERLSWELAAIDRNAMNNRGNVVLLTLGAGELSICLDFVLKCPYDAVNIFLSKLFIRTLLSSYDYSTLREI